MVSVSCIGKLHAFALAEQLERNNLLHKLYTCYAYQKNTLARRIVKRVDKEKIDPTHINTTLFLAAPVKFWSSQSFIWNDIFDRYVSKKISRSNSSVFIGWSGMSLHSLKSAKEKGMTTILERGSSHILNQNRILQEEYKRFKIEFSIDHRFISKELKEYEKTDFIMVPSHFVYNSFIQEGILPEKLVINPFGSSGYFTPIGVKDRLSKFTVVYLGQLSIRKGLIYLFQALNSLTIPINQFRVIFIGKVEKEIQLAARKYKKSNWEFVGHVDHYRLNSILTSATVGVQPSLEEGLSMVIPQLLSCGIPVIATTNTGASDIIQNGKNGFVIPIRDVDALKSKIEELYTDRILLKEMSDNALEVVKNEFTWEHYGSRYIRFLERIGKSGF
jgi:glycosyltransferase involved in cell wall biosynthesis